MGGIQVGCKFGAFLPLAMDGTAQFGIRLYDISYHCRAIICYYTIALKRIKNKNRTEQQGSKTKK